jgi:diphosphomevalonate decarboxylase
MQKDVSKKRERILFLERNSENRKFEKFITLVEHEALTLHAMMMMSEPAFILMKTGTLEVINKLWNFRKETGNPLFFTLDAGANVHLLFPENESSKR